jgi:cytochrome c553
VLAAFFISPCLAQERLQLCAACHGLDGNSTTYGVPSIAGQPKTFIEIQLILFREGLRESDQMSPVTKALPDRAVSQLAEHFNGQAVVSAVAGPLNPGLEQQARELIARKHCGSCHLPDFSGQAQIPRLAGQREEYLADELRAYRANKRVGSDTSMNEAMYGVSDADITALAHFLSRSGR